MLAIEAPKPGTVIHWHISDILTRASGDMAGVLADLAICSRCGSTESSYSDRLTFESENPCQDRSHDWNDFYDEADFATKWRHLLAQKREDYHYHDLVNSLAEAGIKTALGATREGDELRLMNGHHRLAWAVDAGLETVPVKVHENLTDVFRGDDPFRSSRDW